MDQKSSLGKSTIPYGIAFGVIMLLEFVISYSLGLTSKDNAWAGVLMSILNYLVLPILFIMLACNNFKNKLNGGFISFAQCIKAGVAVCVMAALVFSAVSSIVYLAAPQIKEDVLEQSKIAIAESPGMTAEGLKAAMKMSELFMQPYIAIPLSILIYAIVGLIMSLIVGAIVKKDNPGAF